MTDGTILRLGIILRMASAAGHSPGPPPPRPRAPARCQTSRRSRNLPPHPPRCRLVAASPSTAAVQPRALAERARASVDEAGFRAEVAGPGRASQGVRERLPHIDALVVRAAEEAGIDRDEVGAGELTWRLLAHLRVRELRLEGADQADRTIAVSSLRAVTGDGALAAADRVFSRLAGLAGGDAPAAAGGPRVGRRRDLAGGAARRLLPPPAAAEWGPPEPGVRRAVDA